MGVGDHDTRASRRESVTEAVGLFLADAEAASASHLVMVSSAMVYGAFSNNPVPITEESVLRPDPEFVFARQLASAEELVEEWRRGADGRSVTVLRPALAMAEDGTSSLVRALAAGLGHRFGEDDPVAQFVHLDDVASAVALSVERRLDGVYNVAPDGWIPGERVRALTGDRLRFPLPERLARGGRCVALAVPTWPDPARAAVRTPASRGWSPTTSCDRPGGRRRSPTSRPTSRAPRRDGGRW